MTRRQRHAARWLALAATGWLTGCVINAAKPYDGAALDPHGERAIAVVGVTVDRPWRFERFGVVLDQYDVTQQKITGNCFSYNRIEVNAPGVPGPTRFFAFDVPPGPYIYSAFNGGRFAAKDQAFLLPAGRAMYIGNFVLGDNDSVTLRRDTAQDRAALAQALPKLVAQMETTPTVAATAAKPFLCTP
ncbi:hypothetical protein [Pelomonas sp. Root1237]|uniref:hypothetical protein n=1 Tax=Pelomonas sp. Root1237 TaxID=1736434 RepID=UPI0006FF0B47|nr:hypothetical protein [Pelomonas sp. Root1237]KQV88911.1 hypothetical protein ASC91_09655 [Pelomonas sp. Root1237]